MNAFRSLLISVAMIGCATALWSQSPSPNNTSAQAANALEATSEAAPSPSPIISVEPPSLIPPNILPGPAAGLLPQIPGAADLQQLNALFKQSSLGKAADEGRLRLEVAQLETRIRNDEDLHVARASADRMGTDLEKRHQFKVYYQLYYNKLRALPTTPELKAYLDGQEHAHLLFLLQPNTRHETDAAEVKALQAAGTGAIALPTPAQARAQQAIIKP